MWIILFNALDDFGVKELNMGVNVHNQAEIDVAKRKVADEALHGALRIAGLAGVLTSNGYLVSERCASTARSGVVGCAEWSILSWFAYSIFIFLSLSPVIVASSISAPRPGRHAHQLHPRGDAACPPGAP